MLQQKHNTLLWAEWLLNQPAVVMASLGIITAYCGLIATGVALVTGRFVTAYTTQELTRYEDEMALQQEAAKEQYNARLKIWKDCLLIKQQISSTRYKDIAILCCLCLVALITVIACAILVLFSWHAAAVFAIALLIGLPLYYEYQRENDSTFYTISPIQFLFISALCGTFCVSVYVMLAAAITATITLAIALWPVVLCIAIAIIFTAIYLGQQIKQDIKKMNGLKNTMQQENITDEEFTYNERQGESLVTRI